MARIENLTSSRWDEGTVAINQHVSVVGCVTVDVVRSVKLIL
jgi:hypothetical protein